MRDTFVATFFLCLSSCCFAQQKNTIDVSLLLMAKERMMPDEEIRHALERIAGKVFNRHRPIKSLLSLALQKVASSAGLSSRHKYRTHSFYYTGLSNT